LPWGLIFKKIHYESCLNPMSSFLFFVIWLPYAYH